MPVIPLPPMTSRQAKKLNKKTAGQYRYTASQMRRADRREELENRRKRQEEKESKKALNKRKREEQGEKERSVKRRMLQEGKISEEDTWGKVTASQPRLNNFFKHPTAAVTRSQAVAARKLRVSAGAGDAPVEDAANKENEFGPPDSQEETLVNQATVVIQQPTDLGEEFSDIDLLKFMSSQPHLSQPTPPDSMNKTPRTRSRTRTTVSKVGIMSPSIIKRKRSPSPDLADDQENVFPDNKSEAELRVAEDDSAEYPSYVTPDLEAMAGSFSSPSKSLRSVLSEMSVAKVNTRAQEKPDTTTAAPEGCLPSPSKPRDPFASFNSGDFEDDDDEFTWDKENSDPLQTPGKVKPEVKNACDGSDKIGAGPSTLRKKAPPRGFSEQENFDDIYDFDFATSEDDFDDEVDDASLMTLATQKPRSNKIVDLHGSPRKLTPNKDGLVKAAPLTFTPGKMMPPPPPKSQLATPSRRRDSLSFASIGDDDLLEIVEQVEEELSQKSRKGKAVLAQPEFKVPTFKRKRTLPWEKTPLPPPSTQDYLMMMADEVDIGLYL